MMQQKSIKFINKIRLRGHNTNSFTFLNILKLNTLFKIQISSYLYKTFFWFYDDELNNKIIKQSNIHSRNIIRDNRNLSIRRFYGSK